MPKNQGGIAGFGGLEEPAKNIGGNLVNIGNLRNGAPQAPAPLGTPEMAPSSPSFSPPPQVTPPPMAPISNPMPVAAPAMPNAQQQGASSQNDTFNASNFSRLGGSNNQDAPSRANVWLNSLFNGDGGQKSPIAFGPGANPGSQTDTSGLYAFGGEVEEGLEPPPMEEMPMGIGGGGMENQIPRGLISSATSGRADAITTRAIQGSYVIPADVVSSLGQGNTLAGARILDRFKPQVAPQPPAFAIGGLMGDDSVPVKFSGGEYVYAPEEVVAIGQGDVEQGAELLDALVKITRQETVKKTMTLDPPR